MRMEVSKDGSPVFIRVIRVIRGLFTAYFGLRTACRDSSALSRLRRDPANIGAVKACGDLTKNLNFVGEKYHCGGPARALTCTR